MIHLKVSLSDFELAKGKQLIQIPDKHSVGFSVEYFFSLVHQCFVCVCCQTWLLFLKWVTRLGMCAVGGQKNQRVGRQYRMCCYGLWRSFCFSLWMLYDQFITNSDLILCGKMKKIKPSFYSRRILTHPHTLWLKMLWSAGSNSISHNIWLLSLYVWCCNLMLCSSLTGYILSLVLLTLPRQHLVKLYLYVLTALLLFAGHQVSRYTHEM